MRRLALAGLLIALFVTACEGSFAVSVGSSPPPARAIAQTSGPCPPEMAHVDSFCVDRWEAFVVAIDAAGRETPHSPYVPIEGMRVRAHSAPNVVPQGYASMHDAARACTEAGKRLCHAAEFVRACRGPDPGAWYPYGGRLRQRGICNEGKGSKVAFMFGADPNRWTYAQFNDARLNQIADGLAPTGAHPQCVSPDGVFDMVGNLHEWVDEAPDRNNHGRFLGGSYGEAEINGPGCLYVTSAHELTYHDYSTGFRCCRDSR
jgi:formylglycine-generating enzyme required for sulfatase activity